MPISPKRKLAPTDTDVVIPASVLAASAAADAIHQAAYPSATPAAAEPQPAPEPAPEPATAPAAPVTPQVIEPATAPSEQSFEHRYNSMKGRHDRMEAINRQLVDRLNGLEQVIATMAVTTPVPAAPAELAASSFITAADREAYGEDFIAMVDRAAQEKLAPKIAGLESELKILRERLGNVGEYVGKSERDRMNAYLTEHVPNWRQVNDDPAFLNWLALPDRYTDAIKHELLKSAYAANNGPRVVEFFKGFLEEAAPAPQGETVPATPVVPRISLADLAAPGRAKTAAAQPVPAEKPTFTSAEVSQFYVDVANKKFVGREAEKDRIDKEIIEAGREGRIR
jgi:hypothetical protein